MTILPLCRLILKKKYLITIVLLLLAQLTFLFAVKYMNQNLSLNYFSIAKAGNVFNLLIYIGIIFGIWTGLRKTKSGITNKAIRTFLVISWFLLVISFITTKIKNYFGGVYIYDQPAIKY